MKADDFLNPSEINTPFRDGAEETLTYLDWYDMFICAHLNPDEDREEVRRELAKGAEHLAARARSTAGKELPAAFGLGLGRVAEEYGLYGFGFFCLIMAAAQETDPHYREVCNVPEPPGSSNGAISIALAETLYSYLADEEETLEMRRQAGALHYCPLFTFVQPEVGSGSLFYTFEANRQFASLLNGDYLLSKDLALACREETAKGHESATPVHESILKQITAVIEAETQEDNSMALLQLTGRAGSGKSGLILHALNEGTPVIFLSFARYLAMDTEAARGFLSDVLVRCRLLGEVLVIEDVPRDKTELLTPLLEVCARQLDILFLETVEAADVDDTAVQCRYYRFALTLPKAAERRILWQNELSGTQLDDDVSIDEMARKYRLYPGTIHDCVMDAIGSSRADGRDTVSMSDLTEAVLSETTSVLDSLCDRIPLKYTWNDLVVDPRQKAVMETLCSRVRFQSLVDEEWGFEDKVTYGRGASMILFGSPGTGKTMAAQVMAHDIGMALYRVDLSQLVDKYIGETEKNIGKIFDAASDGNVILFFDEADALFSKRTEVQTSNDKHANTEVAYLLQKIEQHEGVIFLATNRYADFDTAFIRRLTYAVHLDRPDTQMRLELYRKILPDKTPREDDLDLEFFAETFELSGSEIKEVLYSAAFIAASDGESLGNRHIVRAIKYQQEKTGKLVNSSVFGKYGIYVSVSDDIT